MHPSPTENQFPELIQVQTQDSGSVSTSGYPGSEIEGNVHSGQTVTFPSLTEVHPGHGEVDSALPLQRDGEVRYGHVGSLPAARHRSGQVRSGQVKAGQGGIRQVTLSIQVTSEEHETPAEAILFYCS